MTTNRGQTKGKIHKHKRSKGDVSILILAAILAAFGVVAIYSASRYVAKTQYGDSLHFVKKQLLGFILGLGAMFLCGRLDYRCLQGKRLRWILYVISVILLGLVFVPGLGVTNYGATRWIGIGGITLQPSELAKYGFIIFASAYMADDIGRMRTFKGSLPVLIAGGIICALIIIEPNMSITVCVALLMLTMLFSAGMRIKHFIFLIIPALIGGVLLILAEPYRLNRLAAFLNPWSNPKGEGYQLLQSLYALGSGGLFGVGLFNSRQKFAFLPFAESDFILSVIGEEVGYVGLFFFFSLLFFIVYRGLKIAYKSKDLFGFMLAIGITMIFGIQTIVNALVVTGSIPPTGLPLPLVSSGNTSIIIFMAEMGVLFNISKQGALTF